MEERENKSSSKPSINSKNGKLNLYNFFLDLFNSFWEILKSPYSILIWFFLLPTISFIVTFQIFIGILYFISYIVLFIIKYFFLKLKLDNIKSIFYKQSLKSDDKNIIIIFLIHLFIYIPKKNAFLYFYTLINSILDRRENSFFKSLKKKSFSEFLIFFLKILFSLLVRLLTTYPLFVLKITNSSTLLFYNLWIVPRENFKAFYSNFILNIIIKHSSSIDRFLYNRKIKFEGVVYTNPGKLINGITFANSSLNSMVSNLPISINRIGSSKTLISLHIPSAQGDITISQVNNNDFGYEISENVEPSSPTISTEGGFINTNKSNTNIIIKSDGQINKELTKNIHTYSGESSIESFGRVKKDLLLKVDSEELKDNLKAFSTSECTILPPYLCDPKFKTLIDASYLFKNLELVKEQKLELAKYFLENYHTPLHFYVLDQLNNILAIQKLNVTMHTISNSIFHGLSPFNKNLFNDFETFHEMNSDIKKEDVHDALKTIKINKFVDIINFSSDKLNSSAAQDTANFTLGNLERINKNVEVQRLVDQHNNPSNQDVFDLLFNWLN